MPRWSGAVLAAVLAVYAAEKVRLGLAPELLWGCPVASALLAAGLLARRPRLIGLGFLFHLAVGLPSYAIYLFTSRDLVASSAALHLASPLLGGVAVWRQGLLRGTAVGAWGLYLALLPLSFFATPALLNVNLAHAPFSPLFGSTAWESWLVNGTAAGAALALGDLLVRRALAVREPA
ncbi:MAG: hypothetical protein ACYC8T_14575 [Myxococcaceae bacterium]